MKKFLLFSFLLLSIQSFSQPYGNEWINYSQKYFKIGVVSKGIHRVTYTDLLTAGFPVTDVNPMYLQLFYKGKEQYMYVSGASDGSIDFKDFFEFYGEPNTGWFDSTFYNDPTQQVNPNFSLINDTSWYFLTWNSSGVTKRMTIENDNSYNSYTPVDYCLKEIHQDYTSNYNSANEGSYYNNGEGYVGSSFGYGGNGTPNTFTIPFQAKNYISKSYKTKLSFGFVGANGLNHRVQITGFGLNIDTSFSSYQTINYSTEFDKNPMGSLTAKAVNTGENDLNAWAWYTVKYSHTMDFESTQTFQFSIPQTNALKYRLDITNFNGDTNSVFYDLTNHKRIIPSKTFQVLMNNEGNSPECFITSGNQIIKPALIVPITSKNANSMSFADFRILKVSYIIVTNKALWNSAQNYANYRSTTGNNVLLLDVDELYNQFGYGISKHPGAIRNFCRYALKYSSVKPEYIFLLGKSVHTRQYREDPSLASQCLVPSAGMPVSDALFTWNLDGSNYSPALAYGRLAVTTSNDVDIYLAKVKEYEQVQPNKWMKNIMQFSGGKDIGEESIMRNYILGYEKILEDTLFGANVQNYYKNSSLPIASTQTDIIKQSINSGVSILNFFGHASAGGFDQNIDLPSSYDNKGKYPMLIANSCYSGDINNANTRGISEQWVLIKDKGTIGFLANVDVGYAFYLDLFSQELVKNLSYRNYQGSIGKSIVSAMRANEKSYPTSSYMKFTSLDMVLHGDPAIKMYGFDRPDLVADVKNISFKPTQLTTDIDSFQVKYVVVNQARAFVDSFTIQVKRTFPNGKTSILNLRMHGIRNQDTLLFKLPIGGISSAGVNKIDVTLDATDAIPELNESNNMISYSFLVNSSDLLPIYPYKYAIYPKDTVTFLASSPDPYMTIKTAKFQLDTSAKFNSPFLKSLPMQYTNGYFSCKSPVAFSANQVYYWRVAIDKGDNNPRWNSSSLIYIPGKTGWSQAQFNQFSEDDYKYISWNETFNTFSFVQSPVRLFCSTVGSPGLNKPLWNSVKYTIDGSMQSWSSCGIAPAFNVAILDSSTLTPWMSNRSSFGQRNFPTCPDIGRAESDLAFTSTDANARIGLGKMLVDSVPKGDYIVVYTWQSGNFDKMEESVIQAFESLGAKQIRSLVNSSTKDVPYIFFVKKGSPQTVQEVVGNGNETITMSADLKTNYYQGNINSTLIGPSKNWSLFSQKIVQADASYDANNYTITAINQKFQEYVAMKQITGNVDTLQKAVDAKAYPYLRLSLSTSDKASRTPGQLKSWQVYYDEYPEGIVSLTPQSKFYADSVQEGDVVKMVLSFKNISSYKMDSILVNYTITNEKNELIQLVSKRLKPLAAGEILTDSISFNTTNHIGTNLLTVEFNPFNPATGSYDQLEQYHFNNLAQRSFHVLKDKRNPLFDVTFDGIHILNGDIVSAKPEIKISLKDENKFFLVDDTSLIQVYLKSMNDNKERRLQFSNGTSGELQFTPGTSKNNKAVISYNPIFTADGLYQLKIQGKDRSGNISGKSSYVISFEVITKSSITNVINYPNPFTTATKFVFTLTGSEIPSDLRIQIFTITGRMIKEISLGDLGALHIGRNITQYAWDGTDTYGDKLANGVYLYRVFSSINGTSIEHRGADIDQYFKKGFGKMYLMR